MPFPSILIFNKSINLPTDITLEKIQLNDITVFFEKSLKRNLLIKDTDDYLIFAHTNIGFRKKLEEAIKKKESVIIFDLNQLSLLSWGFILIVDKINNHLYLHNDIYGIYPLYYSHKKTDFIISNDFDLLARTQERLTINNFGIYDYLLFNYTLKSRTIFNEINQLEGGSKILIDQKNLNVENHLNFVDVFADSRKNSNLSEMAEALQSAVDQNMNPDLPTRVPLTGGFDSKVILSLLLERKEAFEAFTFGHESSPDASSAKIMANFYEFNHTVIDISDDFLDNIENNIDRFIRNHPNAPMLDTLLNYLNVFDHIPASNMVTGKMGGELIVGPVLVSELITTKTAAILTLASNEKELTSKLQQHAKTFKVFDYELFLKNKSTYLKPLLSYTKEQEKQKNINIAVFLLKETYGKFFGVVFSNLFSKYNIINPFLSVNFLKVILNSKYSFLNKKPFEKAPLSHFMSRGLYPKMVNLLQPSVLSMPMDRGYNLKDFLKWYYFPKPFLNYFRRHFIKKKKNAPIPRLYLNKIEELVQKTLPGSPILEWQIINKNETLEKITLMEKGLATKYEKQTLIQMLTLHFITKRYPNLTSNNDF